MNYMIIPGLQKNGQVRKIGKTTGQIMDIVCNYYNITPVELLRKKRHRIYVRPRQQFFYLCWFFDSEPLLRLSEKLGYNHATLIHGRKVVMNEMGYNREVRDQINEIVEIIRQT